MLRRATLVAATLLLAACVAAPTSADARSRPLAGTLVVVDPGHDGGNAAHPRSIDRLVDAGGFEKACDTAGASTDGGFPEHAFTFDVAVALAADLRALGARVVLTRPNDRGVGPCITERAAIANRLHATVAISIHGDGGPASGSGFEVIEPGRLVNRSVDTVPILRPSRSLAVAIRAALDSVRGLHPSTYLGRAGIGTRTDLGGLNWSTVPKVLVECLNLRNAHDAALAVNPRWRRTLAAGLARGIAAWLLHRGSTTSAPARSTTVATTTTASTTTTTTDLGTTTTIDPATTTTAP